MLDLFSEAVEVKVIRDVLLVNLCEKFVALQVAKPLNPAVARLAVVFVIQVLIYITRNCKVRLGTKLMTGTVFLKHALDII